MEKIRKGNDLVILWDIFKIEDGAEVPYDLTGKSLALYLNNAVEKVKVSDFSVSENTVRMVFWGKEQKNSGIYSLTLVENEGLKGMYTVDECSAFELVPRSCLAGGSQESKVDIVTLKLRGTMMVGGGVVDDHLSDTSENAVMNRVVTEELNRKAYAEDVPQRLSQLTDDVGLVTIEDVPTKVSELENDAEYTKKEYVDYYINYLYDGKASKADLAKKQDVLRAGTGIVINGNTVYCTLDTSVFKVVSYLPETGELQKIYLVPSDIRGEKNIYKEYAYIGNKWEVIGEFTSDIDLSEYAKKDDIHTPDWNAGEGEEGHILNRTHYADFVEVDIPEDIASSEAEVTIPHIVGAPILVHYRGYVTSKYLKIDAEDHELHVLSYGPAFKIRRGSGNEIYISGHNDENHRLYIATHFVELNEIFLPETIARKSEIATINGQPLTEGGDIVIEGGEGSYDDTEIQNKLTELSEETIYVSAKSGLQTYNSTIQDAIKALWLSKLTTEVADKLYIKKLSNTSGRNDAVFRIGTTPENDTDNIVAQFYTQGVLSGVQEITINGFSAYESKITINALIDWDVIANMTLSEGYIELSKLNNQKTDTIYIKDEVKKINEQISSSENVQIWKPSYMGYYVYLAKTIGTQINISISDCVVNETRACAFIPVKKGDKVSIKAKGGTNANRLYAVLDRNYTILELSDNGLNAKQTPYELIITQDDAFILVVNYTDYEDTDFVKKDAPKLIDWSGLNVACFGDSLTEFKGFDGSRYTDWMTALTQANIYNLGWGGSRLSSRTTPTLTPSSAYEAQAAFDVNEWVHACMTNDFSIQDAAQAYNYSTNRVMASMMKLAKSMDWSKIDVVTIFAGTNDFASDTRIDEVISAMGRIIQDILSSYPHIKVYWLTPVVRYMGNTIDSRTESNWSDNYQNGAKYTLKELVSAIKDFCVEKKIPCCDMYSTMGWNEYNFAEYFTQEGDSTMDNTHPRRGFKTIAKKIMYYLESNRTF